MPILVFLLELALVVFGTWVAVFSAALLWDLPTGTAGSIFLLTLCPAVAIGVVRVWLPRLRRTTRSGWVLAGTTLGIGCLLGLLVLVASRPDADDVGYLQAPLADVATPDQPFTERPFTVPVQGRRIQVPLLAEVDAFEVLAALVSARVGLDPLRMYHNVFAFGGVLLWAVTYALLFLHFRVPRRWLGLALALTAGFLLLDGNLHRSFGNFSLLRIWQGKVLVWAVLGPAFFWQLLRILRRPSAGRYTLLATTVAVGYSFNRSSILYFSVVGVATCLTYLVAYGSKWRRRKRALLPLLPVVPLVAVGVFIAVSAMPADAGLSSLLAEILFVQSTDGATQTDVVKSYGATWSRSLYQLVIGSPQVLLRDVALLALFPFLLLPRPLRRFLPLFAATVAAVALSPLTGPVWHHFATNAYWRLYYALPVPLCVGLAARLAGRPTSSRWLLRGPREQVLAACLLLLLVGGALERPALSAANGVEWKAPSEVRLPSEPLAFARLAASELRGRKILAVSDVATVLALTEPANVELVYARTRWKTPQGEANYVLLTCRSNRKFVGELETLLEDGVDTLVMVRCDEADMSRIRGFLQAFRLEEEPVPGNGTRYRLYRVHRQARPAADGTTGGV